MAIGKHETGSNDASDASVARVDMKLEVVVIPVSEQPATGNLLTCCSRPRKVLVIDI
jgi:hypothetical protein